VTQATLGPEWQPGPDGRQHRSAARVILFDDADRVLLMRGHDTDDVAHTWWITLGGGIDAGETPRAAAVREVFEEAGLRLRAEQLAGPVVTRSAEFEFFGAPVRQDEQFFLARIETAGELSSVGWTQVERDFVDELRWWPVPELAAAQVVTFPAELPAIVAELVAGWDGTVRDLGTESS
jgi:8-oxo-dGTP pyrophosphatase MutT (NUDIX family)